MSDYEDEFMCDEDEDYDLEYSEDSNSEPDVDLENQYYNSKGLKEDNPQGALDSFQKVLDLEAANGEKGEGEVEGIQISGNLIPTEELTICFTYYIHFQENGASRR